MCDSCVAYRHLLKEIARADSPTAMKNAALLALDDHSVQKLGKLMHQIVKFGVQAVNAKDGVAFEAAMKSLRSHVFDLSENSSVLKGWLEAK